jgi:N-acetylneuraminate epimerase
LLVISGDDGRLVDFQPQSKHPGFRRDVLCYDVRHDTWNQAGDSPLSRATAPTTKWHKKWLVVSGEVKPGRRSPEVWAVAAK